MHAYAVCLQDGSRTIDIDDQSRKVIAFAMHEAEGVVLGIVCHSHATPCIESHLEAMLPEGIIDGFIVEGQHAHGYGPYLPVSYGNELTFSGEHTHEVALCRLTLEMMDGPGENPRMEAAERFVLAALEKYLCHETEFSGSGTSMSL